MSQQETTDAIARRFHRTAAPGVVACAATRHPITFSHVVSDAAMPGRTLPPPLEHAFAVHVHHTPIRRGETWLEGRHRRLPPVDPGGIFIFDLRTAPVAQIHEGFAFSRFQLSRTSIDELSYEQGMKRVGDLVAGAGQPDPVVLHLALAMVRRMATFGIEQDTLFQDGIALALFAHVASVYGNAVAGPPTTGTLAPWQWRRVCDWIEANLHEALSIAELAQVLDLSPSHFARAFSRSAGMPPHRWVLRTRVSRARQLLRATDLPLSEIAAACGFVDQSHFTKVFSGSERVTPGRWRKAQR